MIITMPSWGKDATLFEAVIDRGIDARLEAFTKSKFSILARRYELNFHEDEMQILLRRLLEMEDDEADSWVDTILESEYNL